VFDPPRRRVAQAAGFTLLEVMIVVGLIGVLSAIAVPMLQNEIGYLRLSGDARGISNAMAITKLDAASKFNKARLYIDLDGRSHHVEWWNGTAWQSDGGVTYLSQNVVFSFDPATTPPPNSQSTIGQAPACKDASNNTIANTACIIFNSRGIPIDDSGNPIAIDAAYVTDGTAVYGVTLSATGMSHLWRTPPDASPTWVLQ
jgi:prepilin-type N-terminal cleavage/methylation domain-containing protein